MRPVVKAAIAIIAFATILIAVLQMNATRDDTRAIVSFYSVYVMLRHDDGALLTVNDILAEMPERYRRRIRGWEGVELSLSEDEIAVFTVGGECIALRNNGTLRRLEKQSFAD